MNVERDQINITNFKGSFNTGINKNPNIDKNIETDNSKRVLKSQLSVDEIIQEKNVEIEQILNIWGLRPSGISYGKREEKKRDIEMWLRRFSPSEIDDAFLILKKIQYHDSDRIGTYIKGLSNELKNIFNNDFSDILFYPLGESPASSGGNFLYSYRKELGLPESAFPNIPLNKINLSGVKAIVFFDDIIGSGNQAVTFSKKHLHDIQIDKYYIALLAFEKGYKRLDEEKCFKQVIVHEIISEELRAFSNNSLIFPDEDIRERIKKLCEKYGKILYPKNPLGYDNSQALIVFHHNTPNNTLPIIWASDRNEKKPGYVWYPVWERIKSKESYKHTQINKSPAPLLIFKNVYNFALNEMHLFNSEAKKFAELWIEENIDKDFEIFKETYQFALNEMHLFNSEAKKFAELWIEENIDKFEMFKEAYQFALNEMHLFNSEAKKFAFEKIANK
ncbi:MAG: hypothetical protein KAK00_10260 [Nanoarchaeota archaeon]|nr:hypothetical protein [Nanoarchaeota archaeon]